MLNLSTVGISLDMGIIPPVNRVRSKISSFGIAADYGVIPPKNFFRSKISVLGISGELIGESAAFLFYQVF